MNRMQHTVHAVRRGVLAAAVAVALAACGGGSDGAAPDPVAPTPPTAVPATLTLAIPAERQALSSAVTFGSNAEDPDQKLTYAWDFGDGSQSSLPTPNHAYAQPGTYEVRLTLSNEAGETVSALGQVIVARVGVVQGQVCNGSDQGGWCWQHPLPVGSAMVSYAFADDLRGLAVGDLGAILATDDGGRTWVHRPSPTTLNLNQVTFADAQVAWATGEAGTVLRSTDGGQTWLAFTLGQGRPAGGLRALDATTAIVTSDYGQDWLTVDGGAHWQELLLPERAAAHAAVSGSGDLWAVHRHFDYNDPQGALFHSTDAGATWTSRALPALPTHMSRYLSAVSTGVDGSVIVTGHESGWVDDDYSEYVSRSVRWQTSNGGQSWREVGGPPDEYDYGYRSFVPVDASTTWAIGAYDDRLWRSTDGGSQWQEIARPEGSSYYYSFEIVQAPTAQRVIVRDGTGAHYVTNDAGSHWTRLSAGLEPGTPNYQGLWMFNADEGIAIASDGGSARTVDGGQTWEKQESATPGGYGWHGLQFTADGSIGWTVGDAGNIYLSVDKGLTWLAPVPQTSAPLYGVTDVHFIDAQTGWAVVGDNYYGTDPSVYRSQDGGRSWQVVEDTVQMAGLRSIRFIDAQHGVAVGPAGAAYVSQDGGATWSPRPTGAVSNLNKVVYIDVNTLLAVGESGAIVRSVDGGLTWAPRPSATSQTLNGVQFVDDKTGYAVGDGGSFLYTSDGGLTWTQAPSGTQAQLTSLHFVDAHTGWLVGANGAILATISGGR